jgi:type 1 fimbriae regulatory protein FimB/type 1 fimbriae regulatory protein FimE
MRSTKLLSIKFLTPDELKRLFGVIKSKRDRALFLIAYRHGLRASEVGLLQRTHIDWKQQRIMIERLKGSLPGQHPMQPDEVRILKSYLRSRIDQYPALFVSNRTTPLTRSMLHRLMKQYATEAGLPADKQHFHVLKHTIATHLLDASDDIRFVQDWLGHSNIQNTIIYAQLVSSSRESKARKHFIKLPKF